MEAGTIRREMKLKARKEKLDELLRTLEGDLEKAGCPPEKQAVVLICAEEIFVNIASYAYEGGDGFAWIEESVGTNTVSLCLRDQGKPYDPLKREDPDITLTAQEREVGGLGVFMVKQMADSVSYEYQSGFNCLAMTFSW
ncbi:MAG: ATP-binding protein [Lachnospiraceae bacterium]|nr:ATP-binding protein [Lachnospiraceae bacterium]